MTLSGRGSDGDCRLSYISGGQSRLRDAGMKRDRDQSEGLEIFEVNQVKSTENFACC